MIRYDQSPRIKVLKLISFKNNPKPPSDTQNLHDSAPIGISGKYAPNYDAEFILSDGGFRLFLKEMSLKRCLLDLKLIHNVQKYSPFHKTSEKFNRKPPTFF